MDQKKYFKLKEKVAFLESQRALDLQTIHNQRRNIEAKRLDFEA